MLKAESGWKKLPPNERLLLLTIVSQLLQTSCLRVSFVDARRRSGLSESDFEPALRWLYMKELVTHNNRSIVLTVNSASDEFSGAKFAEDEAELTSEAQEQFAMAFA